MGSRNPLQTQAAAIGVYHPSLTLAVSGHLLWSVTLHTSESLPFAPDLLSGTAKQWFPGRIWRLTCFGDRTLPAPCIDLKDLNTCKIQGVYSKNFSVSLFRARQSGYASRYRNNHVNDCGNFSIFLSHSASEPRRVAR